jgi:hypothetical protein
MEAYSSWSSAPVLPLSERGAQTDVLQVRKVEGLGPVKATINKSPRGSIPGESFTGSSLPSRNIVITIGLNPDWNLWTVEKLRRLVYSYFMTQLLVRLVFRSDDDFPPVEISGYVEDVVPDIFAKDPVMQVSIICPDPFFTAVEPSLVTGIASVGSSQLKGGHSATVLDIDENGGMTLDYQGSIETGVNVKLVYASGANASRVSIQVGNAAQQYFRVTGVVTPTKYLVMNSIPGQKYVQNVEMGSGLITNLLSKVEEGSSWPTLQPGNNYLQVSADAGTQDWEFFFYERFGGL